VWAYPTTAVGQGILTQGFTHVDWFSPSSLSPMQEGPSRASDREVRNLTNYG